MPVLRFVMMLSLVVWLGGLIFFAFVVAPAAFAVLPTHHLAGNVVNRALSALHWMGVLSGLVFLAVSLVYGRVGTGSAQPLAARHVLVCLMILLTLVSQFAISGRLAALRSQMGVIDDVGPSDVRRMEFNRLHQWSVRLEGTVLVLGLAALYLTVQRCP
jgi:uncharacterized membrane protein